ncbi:olfactory receptor 6N2-like [Anabas testudineus]|uniref:olfactory receptor 6N2-like n=1 Tax=Anabas testudineus TaxID=64144 RepID=UPI000E4561A4|nr:olfactory receptor 6N2-like [Anabas testudineus]
MEEELNVTSVIFDGHVEVHTYRYLYFITFFILYILIICSNSTIVYLIWKHQDLHEPMYIFIAALLLNSVLFSTNIYPKLLIDFLSEKQIISYQACLVQYFMFYSLGDSEFLLLTAMAYDRYVSICKPLQYSTIMTKTTVSIFLILAWLIPACQFVGLTIMSSNQKLCSFTLKVIFCNNSIYKLFCATSRSISVFGVFTLINDVVLPVIFIIFSYTRILIICYRSSGEVRKKAAQTCLPHLLLLINYFFLITYDLIIVRLESDFVKTARLIMTLQLVLYNPLFNPIIYGLKMKEISKHLKRLLCQDKINTSEPNHKTWFGLGLGLDVAERSIWEGDLDEEDNHCMRVEEGKMEASSDGA